MTDHIPEYRLDQKVAVITGSTRGIGLSIAETMAYYGARVVITGRKQEVCDAVADRIKATGAEAIGVATDISDSASRQNLIDRTTDAFERIDILVNNAGLVGEQIKMIDTEESYFDHFTDTDLKSLYFMSQIAARRMIEQGCEKGTHPYRIINMASVSGIMAPIGDSVYGTMKAAVAHLTRIMAKELARYGITCNAVSPGYVVTDATRGLMENEKNAEIVKKMIFLRRYARPEEVAGVVNFIASPAGGYLDGVVLPIDGGMSIA